MQLGEETWSWKWSRKRPSIPENQTNLLVRNRKSIRNVRRFQRRPKIRCKKHQLRQARLPSYPKGFGKSWISKRLHLLWVTEYYCSVRLGDRAAHWKTKTLHIATVWSTQLGSQQTMPTAPLRKKKRSHWHLFHFLVSSFSETIDHAETATRYWALNGGKWSSTGFSNHRKSWLL